MAGPSSSSGHSSIHHFDFDARYSGGNGSLGAAIDAVQFGRSVRWVMRSPL
jgi:hypothetical protein